MYGTAPKADFANSGPSGAGRNCTQALLILRAGNVLITSRGYPRKQGSGADSPCQGEMSRSDKGGRVGGYEHEVLIWSRPRWRFAQSLVTPHEALGSGFAGKTRSNGTNAFCAARGKGGGVGVARTTPHGQSRSPPAGGETALRITNAIRNPPPHPALRASFPPGRRLLEQSGQTQF